MCLSDKMSINKTLILDFANSCSLFTLAQDVPYVKQLKEIEDKNFCSRQSSFNSVSNINSDCSANCHLNVANHECNLQIVECTETKLVLIPFYLAF